MRLNFLIQSGRHHSTAILERWGEEERGKGPEELSSAPGRELAVNISHVIVVVS